MSNSALHSITTFPSFFSSPAPSLFSPNPTLHFPLHSQFHHLHLHPHSYCHVITLSNKRRNTAMSQLTPPRVTASSVQDALGGAVSLIQSSPATWRSALLSNVLIFVLGFPILVAGLSLSGIAAAFLLGTLTWRAFGPSGFLLVATYFVIGTAATKVKMAQKVAQGVAEKRRGRRGPGSVIGSSAAGCVFAFLTVFQVGGEAFYQLWKLGFVASFCTKLSDTVSSEIGKAYGKTTYLVTTFKIVPRGTEGAVSIEGTLAGIFASILLAFVGFLMGEVSSHAAIICVIASQIANIGESIIGAVYQEKEGFQWLNNDAVNIINISMGSIIAVLMQQALQSLHP
ncbi:protein VTE6, chloroplastic isoform X1 [Arachis ipaensis]|uniref:Protein VTE6 n=2 Tax=Arachis TaxID=3817 RepID=A0A444Y309_ARAHY|nr:protein VTE6, chloroplastic isoform X1 [Arachis ipaensis]QHN96532.1 uncharacterized protein DS421_18g619330 [Arachis hypogaea]RYQ96325.1 hypothetical protein Ahy_B08g092042 [Arachis hypogaea]